MESETGPQFKSQFAREIAETGDFVRSETERLPFRRVGSESILMSGDSELSGHFQLERSLVQSKLSSHRFESVGSTVLPNTDVAREMEWTGEQLMSPQQLMNILDRKERSWRCANQVANPSNCMNSPSHISRVQTVLSISPSRQDNGENVEIDLARLERENWELRKQLEMAARGWEEEKRCLGKGEERKYEELMREVTRLQNTVNKMESSKSLYESSTKQLVTLLESFASQFAVSSPPSKDSQDSEYFDSLLSRPSMDSDSYKAESESCRPSISSFNTLKSRPSIDSFYTVPSRPSMESFKTIPSRPSEESFETIPSRPSEESVKTIRRRSSEESFKTIPIVGIFETIPSRLSVKSFKTISSRQSLESFKTIPSRSSVDSFNTVPSRPSVDSYRPGNVDNYSRVQNRADRDMTAWNSYGPGKLSNKIPTRSDSYGMLPDNFSKLPNSFRNMPDSYRLAGSYSNLPNMSEAYRRLPERSDSFNSVLSSRSLSRKCVNKERMPNNAAHVPGRSKMLIGPHSVRRALASDTGNGSLARRTCSSVDLLEDDNSDSQADAAAREYHNSGEKRTLKVRSKSFASGLSSCRDDENEAVVVRDKDKTKQAEDNKKDGGKVRRFLKQIRSLVVKDKLKSQQRKINQQSIGDEDITPDKSRTIIRIGDSLSMSRSTSLSQTLDIQQTKVTPKKLKSFHHSTPRLLK